ncbi:ComF family protein [Massilia soli]|uniref:ComF family protein n=1 Tax=Massilia soli TaxID=2792854 RepID=A0ABS7SSH1_9BURK|nr:ComF family protein [Massilia soli]MBZ2208876.1 ComF family protein [Massilia soli]
MLRGESVADRLRLTMQGWPLAVARALLPSSCALCGAGCGGVVCVPCHGEHVAPRRPRCRRCANPLGAGADGRIDCAACLSEGRAFDASVAAADYTAPLDQLVLQLKFGGRLALAPWFALMIADTVREQRQLLLPNVLCPVPLGRQRLVERGFNQALEIARPLSSLLGIPLRPRLAIRALETPAQSGVAPDQRRRNIRNAFIVAPDALAMVRGQHIGIVDDVMTSGHTLDELAVTLKRFGAARVSNLVFARTPPH